MAELHEGAWPRLIIDVHVPQTIVPFENAAELEAEMIERFYEGVVESLRGRHYSDVQIANGVVDRLSYIGAINETARRLSLM